MIDHVKATDIVSAASRHYRQVRGYATEQDVEALRQGRYLDPPEAAHPANPMITGSIGAHFIANVAPDPGKGPGILTPENAARYQQYGAAFEHFRHDVLDSREILHQALNGHHALAGMAHLHDHFGDALGVAGYGHVVRGIETFTGLDSAQARADRLGNTVGAVGNLAQAETDVTARTLYAGSHEMQVAARAVADSLHHTGEAWREGSEQAAEHAARLAPIDPIAGGAAVWATRAAGAIGQYTADDLAAKARLAGELASEGIEHAGERLHEGTRWMARQWHDADSAVQHMADIAASTKSHDHVIDTLKAMPRLNRPNHPRPPDVRTSVVEGDANRCNLRSVA